jgi:hypothetical protein
MTTKAEAVVRRAYHAAGGKVMGTPGRRCTWLTELL